MAGLFDDLIPKATPQASGGLFDDLVPKSQTPLPPTPPALNLMDPTRPDVTPGQSYRARIDAAFAGGDQAERDKAIAALGPDAQMNALPGVLTGAVSRIGGLPGEILNTVSGLSDLTGFHGLAQGIRDYLPLPNMDQFGNLIAGQPENDEVTAFRKVGQLVGPGPLLRGGASTVGTLTKLGQGKPIQEAINAHNAGLTLIPRSVSKDGQSIEQQAFQAASGNVKTRQYFSLKNRPVINDLAAQDIELPKGTTRLTEKMITDQRAKFAADKAAIVDSLPAVENDQTFKDAMAAVGNRQSDVAKAFPHLAHDPEIEKLATSPDWQADSYPPRAAAGRVSMLRDQASGNLKAIGPGNQERHALGLAEKQAADALDDLIARNLIKNSPKDDPYYGAAQVANYKKARELMAKTYDIADVTDFTTGDVNAHAIHKLSENGRPLSGNLAKLAEAAGNFPGSTQPTRLINGMEHSSVVDYYLMTNAIAHGNVPSAVAVALRTAARPYLSSKFNQARIMQQPLGPEPLPGHPYTFAPYQAQVQAGANASRNVRSPVLGLRHLPPTLNALNLYLAGQQ